MAWLEERITCTLNEAFALATVEQHDIAWLDSGVGHSELGQRSMVALELEPAVELYPDRLVLSNFGPRAEVFVPQTGLWAILDQRLDELRRRDAGCPVGLVGYVTYEAARFIDRALPLRWLPGTGALMRLDSVLAAVVEDASGCRLVVRGRREAEARRRLEYWREALGGGRAQPAEAPLEELRRVADQDPAQARAAVAAVVEAIAAGRVFQACYTYPIRFERPFSLAPYFVNLRRRSPGDYAAYLRFGDVELASSSPECFLDFRGRCVSARPMKGTRRRVPGEDEARERELAASVKDRAENVMIVDLMRNDLGRIARPGSVRVPELFTIERYATVHQMTSTVSAELEEDVGVFEAFSAAFPPGSMTGAPKIEACHLIGELEAEARGIYAGCVAWIGLDDRASFSVVIRSLQAWKGELRYNVGGGIVADSTPEEEWQESRSKAALVLPSKP